MAGPLQKSEDGQPGATYQACLECDLLHDVSSAASGVTGYCERCGAHLFQRRPHSLDRTLSFAITGLVFFSVANIFPVLTFTMNGNSQTDQMIGGVFALFSGGYWPLGILVLFVSVIAPFLVLSFMVGVFLPLKFQRSPAFAEWQVRALLKLKPWAMSEIFVIGIMVAFVKLGDFALVTIGPSLFGIVSMVLATVFAFASIDAEELWARLEEMKKQ